MFGKMKKETKEVTESFIEQMGMNSQADGFPRISGKIMGLMIIEDGPFSFADFEEKLLISRGSISTNTRLLENLGIIERISKPGERQDFFQLSPDSHLKLLGGIAHRMRRYIATVQKARKGIPEHWEKTHLRLTGMELFYSRYLKSTEALISEFENDDSA